MQDQIQEKLNRKEKRRLLLQNILPFTGLVFIFIFLMVLTRGALIKSGNLLNLINQCFTVIIVGVGAVFVYAHGGMDFSLGSSCGLAQYVCVVVLMQMQMPVWTAILAAMLIGTLSSGLVGSISYKLGVPVFVVSLCVRSMCSGLLSMFVNGAGGEVNLNYSRYAAYNNEFLKLGVILVMIAVGYYLFEKTAFGKSQKAIGGNATCARHAGINVFKTQMLAYLFLGACVGIAAFFQVIRFGAVSSQSGSGLEFDIMIAMVLGGFPMQGGSAARLRSMIIGAMTSTLLTNGLVLANVDVGMINGIKGILLIIIVAISYDRTTMKQINMLSM